MWRHYLRRARELPFRVAVSKAAGVARRQLEARRTRVADLTRPTYGAGAPEAAFPLAEYVPALPVNALTPRAEEVASVAKQYLAHRVDLLGSGWVELRYGMRCPGVEGINFPQGPARTPDPSGAWLAEIVNAPNLPCSRRAFALVDPDYAPIDWQLDFKSGYRWPSDEWVGEIRYGHVRGADVKVPWDLSRMQHLPQLAVAHAAAAAGLPGFEPPERYARECRNQILDFLATNPPRYGVNWASTMDVAIRVANWLVTYDALRAHGARFDDAFERVLAQSVVDHGEHILRFLEWNDELRGNHYLANLAGLLFVAAYLPPSRRTDGWLAFAARELFAEVALQFHPDGSNFEGSTAYHRLSAEMVLWSAAIVGRIAAPRVESVAAGDYDPVPVRGPDPGTPPTAYPAASGTRTLLPPWIQGALLRMAEFTADVTSGDVIAQVGDNDSGRFLKWHPPYVRASASAVRRRYENLDRVTLAVAREDSYYDERHCDQRQLVAAVAGLTGRGDHIGASAAYPFDAALMERLAAPAFGGANNPESVARAARPRPGSGREPSPAAEPDAPWRRRWVAWSGDVTDGSLVAGLTAAGYPDFGLYVFRSRRLFLVVRCGPVGQRGHGGHDHNDQLSIELTVDGVPVLRDAGAYLYTPLPERRNEYRSVAAHNGPWPWDDEPARLTDGPFRLGAAAPGVCLEWADRAFTGELRVGDRWVRRRVVIGDAEVEVVDTASGAADGWAEGRVAVAYSPGYGIRER